MTPLALELSKPEYDGLTDQQAFDKITQPVETLNNQAWTVDAINDALPADVNTVLSTLESAPLFRSAFIALSVSGLELASDKRQAMIDVIADMGQWSNELRASVKQLGRPIIAPWQSIGLPSEPTLDEVIKERIILNTRLEMAAILGPIQSKSTAVNGWLDNIDSAGMTAEQVSNYCASLLASDDGNPSEAG